MNEARGPRMWRVAERLLLTLWVGGMWGVGYLAVPVLFAVLDDRTLAGELAGHMFSLIYVLGTVCGVILLAAALRRGAAVPRWRIGVLAAMLAIIAVEFLVLSPQIAAAREQAAATGAALGTRFAVLHGTASVLYLVTSMLGLVLAGAGGARRADD